MSRLNNLEEEMNRDSGRNMTEDDSIVDLKLRINFTGELVLKFKIFHCLPVSIENFNFGCNLKVILQWIALDHNDFDRLPEVGYLGIQSLERFDFHCSLIFLKFFDLLSIPPLSSVVNQDFFLDIVYDLLDPTMNVWVDFIRGRLSHPVTVIDKRKLFRDAKQRENRARNDSLDTRHSVISAKTQLCISVLASKSHKVCRPYVIMKFGSKENLDHARESKYLEKQTRVAARGSSAAWTESSLYCLCNPNTCPSIEDWM